MEHEFNNSIINDAQTREINYLRQVLRAKNKKIKELEGLLSNGYKYDVRTNTKFSTRWRYSSKAIHNAI